MDESEIRQEKLFAKLSGKRGIHLVVFTDVSTMSENALQRYSVPPITNAIDFEPGRTLHHDEWYKIELDDVQITAMISPYTRNADSAADNNTIRAEDYEKVVAIYKTNGENLLVTKISAGMRVESKTFIGINDHPVISSYQKAIEFTGIVDAYYDGDGNLYFKNYSKISSLFPGIEVFYREATSIEKTTFLEKPFLDVSGIDIDSIGVRDSTKIAAILDDERIKLDDAKFQKNLIEYAKEYAPELVSKTEEGKLKISDKKTLHKSLNVLTDRYYTSGLFNEKREAVDSIALEP